jgi:hypothetical protein
MFIVAEHMIKNPDAFFGLVPEVLKGRPGIKVLQSFPNMSNDRTVCLWEAHSVDALKDFLDPLTAHSSRNTYYEVDNKRAMGLPSRFVVAEHTITNPDAFFGLVPEVLKGRPGIKVLQSLPNMSNDRTVCLWEAHSVDALKDFLDPLTAKSSRNTYYEVDSTKAMGLPSQTASDLMAPAGTARRAA